MNKGDIFHAGVQILGSGLRHNYLAHPASTLFYLVLAFFEDVLQLYKDHKRESPRMMEWRPLHERVGARDPGNKWTIVGVGLLRMKEGKLNTMSERGRASYSVLC